MLFKNKYPESQRISESKRILDKYPDKIPIICEKFERDKSMYKLDKNKYLASGDMTMGQFVYIIRKRLKMKETEALFLFVNNTLIPNTEELKTIYNNNKNDDGFLYIQFSLENTFG